MNDGPGVVKFMNAVAEMAHGANEPSIPPVWCRELFSARDPPSISCTHCEYEEVLLETKGTMVLLNEVVHCSFFFGPTEEVAIRRPTALGTSGRTVE